MLPGHPERRSHGKHRAEDPESAQKRGSSTNDSDGESVSCSGNKEELRVEEWAWLGPTVGFQSQTLQRGRFLLIYLVSTFSLDRKSSLPPSLGKEPLSQQLPLLLGSMKSLVSLSPGFLKTRLLIHFSWNDYPPSFGVWFPLALPFLFSPSPPPGFAPLRLLRGSPSTSSQIVSLHSPPISSLFYQLPGAS